jgi:hypothetical protein
MTVVAIQIFYPVFDKFLKKIAKKMKTPNNE